MVKGPGGEKIADRRGPNRGDIPNWLLALITILLGLLIQLARGISATVETIKTNQAVYLNQQQNDEKDIKANKDSITVANGNIQGHEFRLQAIEDKERRHHIE